MHALPLLICNNNAVDKSVKDITTIGDLNCSLLTRFLAILFSFHTLSELMESIRYPSVLCRTDAVWIRISVIGSRIWL